MAGIEPAVSRFRGERGTTPLHLENRRQRGLGGGGEIVWSPGALRPGTGIRGAPREVSFQVALVPSANQIGSAVTLVNGARFIGRDSFADVAVSADAPAVTTKFSTDPQFEEGQDKVVE